MTRTDRPRRGGGASAARSRCAAGADAAAARGCHAPGDTIAARGHTAANGGPARGREAHA